MADRITLSPCVWPLYTQTLRFFSNREWEPILYKGTCWWHRPALSSFNKPGGSTEEPMFWVVSGSFYHSSRRDEKRCSSPSSQSPTCGCHILPPLSTIASYRREPAFEFKQPSPQLIKNTFQKQIYLHFNNLCNYHYSSSSEEQFSCMQITEFVRNFRKEGTCGL